MSTRTPFAIGHTAPGEPRAVPQVIKGLPCSERVSFSRRIVRVLVGPIETADEALRRHALENAGNGGRES